MVSTIIWNVRGANQEASRLRLRQLINIHDVSLVVVLETKLKPSKLYRLYRNMGFSSYLANPLAGKYMVL